MSNENDDATQLGSIGRHMSKPQQPGTLLSLLTHSPQDY